MNYNSPGQTVVACASEEADAFASRVQAEGGRAMRLKVSGGFHSPFMQNAQAGLVEALKSAPLAAPRIPLYANQTALPYSLETARECLAGEVAHPVRWQQTIENLIAAGAESFLELGPGATLAGLGKRIAPDHAFLNAEDAGRHPNGGAGTFITQIRCAPRAMRSGKSIQLTGGNMLQKNGAHHGRFARYRPRHLPAHGA